MESVCQTGPPFGSRLEHKSHDEYVPELPALPPVLLTEPALLDEAELAVEADRGLVPGKDLQAQLVHSCLARPLDARLHESRADALPAPGREDAHPERRRAGARAAEDAEFAHHLAAGLGHEDECVVGLDRLEEPFPSQLAVDRRLREDVLALGRHRLEQAQDAFGVLGTRSPDPKRTQVWILG